jgi:hypothetical protein
MPKPNSSVTGTSTIPEKFHRQLLYPEYNETSLSELKTWLENEDNKEALKNDQKLEQIYNTWLELATNTDVFTTPAASLTSKQQATKEVLKELVKQRILQLAPQAKESIGSLTASALAFSFTTVFFMAVWECTRSLIVGVVSSVIMFFTQRKSITDELKKSLISEIEKIENRASGNLQKPEETFECCDSLQDGIDGINKLCAYITFSKNPVLTGLSGTEIYAGIAATAVSAVLYGTAKVNSSAKKVQQLQQSNAKLDQLENKPIAINNAKSKVSLTVKISTGLSIFFDTCSAALGTMALLGMLSAAILSEILVPLGILLLLAVTVKQIYDSVKIMRGKSNVTGLEIRSLIGQAASVLLGVVAVMTNAVIKFITAVVAGTMAAISLIVNKRAVRNAQKDFKGTSRASSPIVESMTSQSVNGDSSPGKAGNDNPPDYAQVVSDHPPSYATLTKNWSPTLFGKPSVFDDPPLEAKQQEPFGFTPGS